MLIVAIRKRIMVRQKKRLLAIVIIPVLITIGTIIMGIFPLADYQQARLDVLLHPSRYLDNMSYNYTPVMVKRLTQQFSVTGSRTFASQVESLPSMEMHTNYAVTSMFTWFGMAIGIIILLFLFVFCIYSLIMSLKQNNRISFLFGTMCSVTLLVRCIIYVLNNWGLFIPYSTYFPFLQYGLGNALVSGCYIGIIMCV